MMQTADVQEINRVLQTFPEGAVVDGNDRRDAERFAFASQQTIAPYSGKDMPRAADFRRVACHDISAGGMSFYWDRPLDFEYVVVALESTTASLRVIGRATFCVPEGDGNYRIGCQFIKRLK
jgi:hypothetical protein